MVKYKLDVISLGILKFLIKDSRMRAVDIAQKVHVSATTVKDRIDKMVAEQIITRCSVDVNLNKVVADNPIQAILYVKLKDGDSLSHTAMHLHRVAMECDSILCHYREYGRLDRYVLEVAADSEKSYNELMRKLYSIKGIKKIKEKMLSHKVICHDISDVISIA